MKAVFILATDDESLNRTLDSIGEIKNLHIITNGYKMENDEVCINYTDVRKAYNHIVKTCIKNEWDAVIIRSGAKIDNLEALFTTMDTHDMVSGVVLDPNNTQYALSHTPSSAYPYPKFISKNKTTGVKETQWVDGPVIGLKLCTMENNGYFDTILPEIYSFVDYAVRARWCNLKVAVCHDTQILFVNDNIFSGVLKENEEQQKQLILGRHLMERKFGGALLQSLTGE